MTGMMVQLTTSSRRENGGAYREDVFGGQWMASKGKMIQFMYIFANHTKDINPLIMWGDHTEAL